MTSFTFIDLFAGIGGTRLAFERAGGRCLFASEINEEACKVYLDNFGEMSYRDIREIDEDDIPNHDVLTACIPIPSLFCVDGRHSIPQKTVSLFSEVIRIIEVKKPRAFFFQGIAGLLSPLGQHQNVIGKLENKLNHYILHKHIINASCVVPQRILRSYIVGFKERTQFTFPILKDRKPKLRDILELDVNPKYEISDKLLKRVNECIKKRGEDRKLNKLMGKRFEIVDTDEILQRPINLRTVREVFVPQGKGRNLRRLTPRECARLMGFPDSFKIPFSDTKAYRLLSNSVIVPIVERIAKTVVDCLILQVQE